MSDEALLVELQPPQEQKKRGRSGKCARRRKRKARAILEAAAAASKVCNDGAGGEAKVSQVDANNCQVPSDRGYVLEGVTVRRIEEWKRRNNRKKFSTALSQQHDEHIEGNEKEEEYGASFLDPSDQQTLQSQLGFIPGNVICVAARNNKINSGASSKKNEPSVVKLYPIAVREPYKGGKSGYQFKGRKRGPSTTTARQQTQQDKDDGGACVQEVQKNNSQKKRERSWLVHKTPSTTTSDKSENITKNEDLKNNNIDMVQQQQVEEETNQIIEPFPTLYWLTSPYLRAQISKLEISKEYNVQKMECRIRSSQLNLDQMQRAHKSYGNQRWNLLTSIDQSNIIQRGWKNVLDDTNRGVAGIRLKNGKGYDCVKCLHAHAAHYLAQVAEWEEEQENEDEVEGKGGGEKKKECDREDLNLVGKWTMEALASVD